MHILFLLAPGIATALEEVEASGQDKDFWLSKKVIFCPLLQDYPGCCCSCAIGFSVASKHFLALRLVQILVLVNLRVCGRVWG